MVNNIVLVNLSIFVVFQDGPKADLDSSELTALLESSRKTQDKALADIGLYRFLIPEDGNCLFRAIASQLNLEQESAHRELRQEAVRWMRQHAEELLAYGLVDNFDEISESGKVGVWPGQAAIVAIANVRSLNIAIVQGGDKGPIDFQHIAPFDDLPAGKEPKSVMLAYLYSGHYDGVAYEMKVNPEYAAWRRKLRQRANADEQLAQNIALEDAERDTYTRRSAYSTSGLSSSRYAGGSTLDPSSRYAGNDMHNLAASRRSTGDSLASGTSVSMYSAGNTARMTSSRPTIDDTSAPTSPRGAGDAALSSGRTSSRKPAAENLEPGRYDYVEREDNTSRPRTISALSNSSNSSTLSKHSRQSDVPSRVRSPLGADYDNVIHSIGIQEEEERRMAAAERRYPINVKHVLDTDRGLYSSLNGYYDRSSDNLYSTLSNRSTSHDRAPTSYILSSDIPSSRPQAEDRTAHRENFGSSKIASLQLHSDSDSGESTECDGKTTGRNKSTRPMLQHSHTFDNTTARTTSSRMPSSRTAGNMHKDAIENESSSVYGSIDNDKYLSERISRMTKASYAATDRNNYLISDADVDRRYERGSSLNRGSGEPERGFEQAGSSRHKVADTTRIRVDREVNSNNDVKTSKQDSWFEGIVEKVRGANIGIAQQLEHERAMKRVNDHHTLANGGSVSGLQGKNVLASGSQATTLPYSTSSSSHTGTAACTGDTDDTESWRKTDKRGVGSSSEVQPNLAQHLYDDPTTASARGKSNDRYLTASSSRGWLKDEEDAESRSRTGGRDTSRQANSDLSAARSSSHADDKRYDLPASYRVERHAPTSATALTAAYNSSGSARYFDHDHDNRNERSKLPTAGYPTNHRLPLTSALPPRSSGVISASRPYTDTTYSAAGISWPSSHYHGSESRYTSSSSSSRPTSAAVYDHLYSAHRRGSTGLTATERARLQTRPAWR
jgi:hypothetical protein